MNLQAKGVFQCRLLRRNVSKISDGNIYCVLGLRKHEAKSDDIRVTFIQHRAMSNFASQHDESVGSYKNQRQPITLKQLIRPFLMQFHPDRQGNSTAIAREVNLKAIQTLNGMIDVIDQIQNRAIDVSSVKPMGRIQLEQIYSIEFLVPSSSRDTHGIKRPKDEPVATRRSVDISFHEMDIKSAQMIDINGNYSVIAAKKLRFIAMQEITKLLRIAGLQIPTDMKAQLEWVGNDVNNIDSGLTPHERMLQAEFDIGDGFGPSGQGQSMRSRMSPYERSRKLYMSQIDWKKHKEMYEQAMEDMKRDIATQGLIAKSEERKQRLISQILANIRIQDSDGIDRGENESLDALQQLIAIRRISLLFADNFDQLEMEDMSRIWENSLIVLTPARQSYQVGKRGLPYSRLRRLKEGRESGFKFSYNSDDTVTIKVPIDFLDDELIYELKRHLSDFYSVLLAKDGFEDYFPSFYKDFQGAPNFT